MKLEQRIKWAALKAILRHPDSRLYAKVNHEDNFCLQVSYLASHAIMDIVATFETPDEWAWYNAALEFDVATQSNPYNKLVKEVCVAVYKKLRVAGANKRRPK